MSRSSPLQVLAIGIDAAEPSLVKTLIVQGALPALGMLLGQGRWGTVRSPADIGSGAVWPTFMTGKSPLDHGVYSVLPWDPNIMSLVRLATDDLTPFWKPLAQQGYHIGVLDVPFAPVLGLEEGFEISEWGAHDRVRGQMRVSPSTRRGVVESVQEHPLNQRRVVVADPGDWTALREVSAGCESGAGLRGELAARLISERPPHVLLAAFTEVHHASHYLWHTLPAAASESRPRSAPPAGAPHGTDGVFPDLIDVYKEVDRQIGRLISLVDPGAMIVVFSLHGMKGTRGVPTVLDRLLRALGWAALTDWRSRTWAEQRRWAMAALKQTIPDSLRRRYRRGAAGALRSPQQQVPLPYDWARTRAFSVPTDQHGWIRMNLKGRETAGIIDPAQYDECCSELERVLRGLVTRDGSSVVSNVIRVGREAGRPPGLLPDLVVHWTDAALATPLRVAAPQLSARPTGTQFTGQHAPDGFFILRPPSGQYIQLGDVVAAEDLHRLILAGLYRKTT